MSDNIFREVDEELRGDRGRKLWRRFGPYLIGAAVLIVLIVAGNEVWKWWKNSNEVRSSELFETALTEIETGNFASARSSLDLTESQGSGQYPMLARFRAAALLADEGDTAAAIAAYDTLATTLDTVRMRELALLYAAYLLVDEGDVAGVTSRLVGMQSPDHPMRNAAREAIGLVNYQVGDLGAARDAFSQIVNDPASAQDIAQRASIFLEQLTAEGVSAPATDAAPAPDTVPEPAS
jgi:hypothetical protein